MSWRPAHALPVRLLVPLLLFVLALGVAATNHVIRMQAMAKDVAIENAQRLSERLGIEQTRLRIELGFGNRSQLRRLVSGLALHEGVTDAWLLDEGDNVIAALARTDLRRPLAEILAGQSVPLRQAVHDAQGNKESFINIRNIAGEAVLLGHVAIYPRHRLLVRIDLAPKLAVRAHTMRSELWRESGAIFLLAALLAAMLHALWFRRAARLTATASELGAGRLDARARLQGRDELAGIGDAIDRMADELQVRQSQLQQLESLVIHSPVVIITWRDLPNRPVTFVSENIRQWGYSPAELLSGKIQYTDLIHHADLPDLERDVVDHHAHGPDEYRQEYRLRHADGHWLWIDDHTWLTRDANGAVTSIAGALTDISERHRLEEARRQQGAMLGQRNAELERFNRAMVGRELDMMRLKAQVNELSRQLGQEPPYAATLTDPAGPAESPPADAQRDKGHDS